MKSLKKALAIMETFLDCPDEEIGITELVERVGLNISTVHHIASVLVKEGYLSQAQPRAKYGLGAKFLQFGHLATSRMKIGNMALPFLTSLSQAVNQSVNLAVLDSAEAVYVQCISSIDPSHQLRTFTQSGARVPLYCTGVGKVLLAYMPETELRKYFQKCDFYRRTENTITDPVKLEDDLSVVKRRGYAVDNEEMELGVRCIAAPVRDFGGGVIAAVSISGPTARVTHEYLQELYPLLKNRTSAISAVMGYRGEKALQHDSGKAVSPDYLI